MDEQQQAYDEQLAAQQAANEQAMTQQAAADTPSTDDLVAELEKLGKLKEEGLLTEDEFAAQKAKLLG